MKNLLFLSAYLFSTLSCLGQAPRETADRHFNEGNYTAAIEAYKSHVDQSPGDSLAWYNMATSALHLGHYPQAIGYFEEAGKHNFPKSLMHYGMAHAYALSHHSTKALDHLRLGAENGLRAYIHAKNDTAFVSMADDPAFEEILRKIETNAYPCLSSEERRHFDFWIGKWDVYARGSKVGENDIKLANGGCVIHENYTTQGNYTGQSMNYYDPIDKKWHQHWVGAMGDTYNYLETDKGPGMLQLQSDFVDGQGARSISRMTFTLNTDGTVRQLMESSTDEGKTWSIAFDGLYKPHQE